jgi:hypothetical protein
MLAKMSISRSRLVVGDFFLVVAVIISVIVAFLSK